MKETKNKETKNEAKISFFLNLHFVEIEVVCIHTCTVMYERVGEKDPEGNVLRDSL